MYFHKRYILPGTLWPARQQPEQNKVKRYGLPTLPQCRIVPTMEQKVTKLFPPGNIVSKKGFMFSHLSKAINNFKSGYKNYTTLDNIFWHSFPIDFDVVKCVFGIVSFIGIFMSFRLLERCVFVVWVERVASICL